MANHFEGTPSTSHGMASCVEPVRSQVSRAEVSQSSTEERQGQGSTKVSTVVSLCTTTFAPCQQDSRESGSRGGDICIGRLVDTLKTSARSPSSGSGSCFSASNPGASGSVQALLGTRQETRVSRAGGHRQSTRAKSGVRDRGRRGRSEACQTHGRGRNCPDTPCCVSASFSPYKDSKRRPSMDGWWSSPFRRHPVFRILQGG